MDVKSNTVAGAGEIFWRGGGGEGLDFLGDGLGEFYWGGVASHAAAVGTMGSVGAAKKGFAIIGSMSEIPTY